MADDTGPVYNIATDAWVAPLVSSAPPQDVFQQQVRATLRVIEHFRAHWRPSSLEDHAYERLLARFSADQRAQWLSTGYVDTLGSHRTDVYRILPGTTSGNIIRHRDLMRFCVVPIDLWDASVLGRSILSPSLIVLCQFVLLTMDEPRFEATANRLGQLYELPPPW